MLSRPLNAVSSWLRISKLPRWPVPYETLQESNVKHHMFWVIGFSLNLPEWTSTPTFLIGLLYNPTHSTSEKIPLKSPLGKDREHNESDSSVRLENSQADLGCT